jgi:deazaflavin-dependent oxidoreductase (nitroreductase family)
LHKWIYQATQGRVGSQISGNPVLVLFTTGRKSGQPRSNALYYFRDGSNYIVVASNAGEPSHPAWWLNLREKGGGEILLARKRMRVKAHEAVGEERARLWDQIGEADDSYREYEKRTKRSIPVVVLASVEQA